MNAMIRTGISVGALLLLAACHRYPMGSLYTGTTVPHNANDLELAGAGKSGDKVGESCATGILYLVAFGDASVDAAKKAGGITDVHSVEFKEMNILGIYMKGCTEVHGK
jgi:hypothetical protein